ncbi:hypothetical protein LguiA_004830 [Lonicera macranthoides]
MCEQAKVDDSEDRISNLPDAILSHILSFISTKEAVRTGILSKRWKFVWTSVPVLDVWEHQFQLKTESSVERLEKARTRFLNFVDRVLMVPNIHSLEKVYINGSCHDFSHTQSWIDAATERNVRKLELYIYCEHDVPHCKLTLSSFSLNTVVDLKLYLNMVIDFHVTSTCFPNLKVLELDSVICKDDSSAENLFTSCPVLENLVIVRSVKWDNLRNLNVTSRSLKSLSVRSRIKDEDRPWKVVIDAPALESLEIVGSLTQDYVVQDVPSIIKASFQLMAFGNIAEEDYGNCQMRMFELLRRVSNVKFLSLKGSILTLILGIHDLPVFHNLIRLEFIVDVEPIYWDQCFVEEFLNRCPMLEAFIFETKLLDNVEDDLSEDSWLLESNNVPSCSLSHLKTIEIMGDISEDEVEMVRNFLENAKVLEKMTLTNTTLKRKLQICAKLFELSKCSIASTYGDLVISFV